MPKRRVLGILWDIDNVPVFKKSNPSTPTLPTVDSELEASFSERVLVDCAVFSNRLLSVGRSFWTDEPEITEFRAYGNSNAFRLQVLRDSLERCGVKCFQVSDLDQAADLELSSYLRSFVSDYAEDDVVVIVVSRDKGFLPAFEYAKGRGCRTVALANFKLKPTQGVLWSSLLLKAWQRVPTNQLVLKAAHELQVTRMCTSSL
ncbi:hypothetical protein CYMTET_31713 [Cymbomonas tetramitiformis]|uniref:NYN domain-containing protein n=1 Tax=Cymbomonas tetramitiformis TaxID=36881 RepID=A0AAE0FGA3_9CHLO|nr:hypothetical protein CYMTET_31713 [Cymbomonas tetramitiformis]